MATNVYEINQYGDRLAIGGYPPNTLGVYGQLGNYGSGLTSFPNSPTLEEIQRLQEFQRMQQVQQFQMELAARTPFATPLIIESKPVVIEPKDPHEERFAYLDMD